MIKFIDFTKKIFLITGASSGIGEATALLLDQLGANLILVGRNIDKLNQIHKKLAGKQHVVLEKEIVNWGEIKKDFKMLCQQHGALDGLVHCAGMHLVKPLRFMTDCEIDTIFDVNVKTTFRLLQAFRQKGCCTSNASAVLMSSIVGQVGQAGVSLYAATKGSVEALTKSLALELAPENIRINCIAPGIVNTKMTTSLFEKTGRNPN